MNAPSHASGTGERMEKRLWNTLAPGLLALAVTTGVWVAPAVAQPAPGQFTCTLSDATGATSRVTRIIGGSNARPGDWPWQVALLFRGEAFCGGSLIHPEWVLTAAHCLDLPVEAVTVQIGGVRIGAGDAELPARRFFPHPRYTTRKVDGADYPVHDIGLVRLSRPAEGQRRHIVQLQGAALEARFAQPSACAVVTGWGHTQAQSRSLRQGYSAPSPVLQQVDMPIIDRATCAAVYPGGRLDTNQICAGYVQGTRDSCEGDSGGPLVVPGGPTGWTQVGVVSWGEGCAQPNAYGVYTRVAPYIEWIQRTVRENGT